MAIFTEWCFKGESVYYGELIDNSKTPPVIVTSGRFDPGDIDSLIQNDRWSFNPTEPEDVGETRESKDCCACNDYKFPPCENCSDDIPKLLIERFLNDFNPIDPSKTDINLEVIPVDTLDPLLACRINWVFGDGESISFNGTIGQRIGFRQKHSYPFGTFNGIVTLQILDRVTDQVLSEESVDFFVVVNEERPTLPLNLILDLIDIVPEIAPATATLELIGNQAMENILVDWGDGSEIESIIPGAPTTILSHFYLFGGNKTIFITASSAIDGNQGSISKTISIPGEPAPDQKGNTLAIALAIAAGVGITAFALSRRKKR